MCVSVQNVTYCDGKMAPSHVVTHTEIDMPKVEDKIERAHYVATEHDVELLAASHLACTDAARRADGHYLRILVAGLQAKFDGNKHRKKAVKADFEAHAALLTEIHQRYYPWVLKGVTTDDVADDPTLHDNERRLRALQRNARAGFARSTASTLLGFIRAGGDVRGLDVTTVTKTSLRTWTRAATSEGSNPRVDRIVADMKRLERDARNLMAEDPDEARVTIQDCMERLQRILDELGTEGSTNGDGGAGHTQTMPSLVESGVFQGRRGAKFRPRTATA
jgi:hypothetical protein